MIPNEYGSAKHPLFFLRKNKVQAKEKDLFLKINESNTDISSAMYHEEIHSS